MLELNKILIDERIDVFFLFSNETSQFEKDFFLVIVANKMNSIQEYMLLIDFQR